MRPCVFLIGHEMEGLVDHFENGPKKPVNVFVRKRVNCWNKLSKLIKEGCFDLKLKCVLVIHLIIINTLLIIKFMHVPKR